MVETWRAATVSLSMLMGAVAIASASRTAVPPARESFATFPGTVGRWKLESAPPLEPAVLTVLGVDDYVNRVYSQDERTSAELYIGYYGTQRQDDSIHSPMNCLPGAGWEPASREYVTIPVSPGQAHGSVPPVYANRVVIEKGLDRQIVLYWYQAHGRSIPNEYWSKAYMVYDALRLNRTDAALVRVAVPVDPDSAAGDYEATAAATAFTQALYPVLGRFIPS
jgi:EpsI family protein